MRGLCFDAGHPNVWLSSDPDEKAAAAEICELCPIMRKCYTDAVAERSVYGVRGGVDFSRKDAP